MPVLKVLAACSSLTAGAAAVCLVGYLQSDSLAFTTPKLGELRSADWSRPTLQTGVEPQAHVVQLEDIRVEGRVPALQPVPRPVAAPEPPCIPSWRELATGPTRRKVRALCPDVPSEPDQPLSVAGKDFMTERRAVPKLSHGSLIERPITLIQESAAPWSIP